MAKPKPVFVGGPEQSHEDVVRSFVASLPDPVSDDDRMSRYRKGPCWGQWVVGDTTYWVTLVAVKPGEWAFAVFLDGPDFRV